MSATAARIAVLAAVGGQLLALAAILLRPELDPSWQPPSEWAIGRLGWIQSLAFLAAALGYAALYAALRREAQGWKGRAGRGLLLACALATAGVAICTADPITVPFDALSLRGTVHVAFGTIQLLLVPFAVLLIQFDLARCKDTATARLLSWTAALPLLALLLFASSMAAIEPADHHVGPDVQIGWPARALLLTYALWTAGLAGITLRNAPSAHASGLVPE